jgi:hypothetical protein
MRRGSIAWGVLVAALAVATPCAAQNYGPNQQFLIVAPPDLAGSPVLASSDGLFFRSPGSAVPVRYYAHVSLPPGALLTNIFCYAKRDAPGLGVPITFQRVGYNFFTNASAIFQTFDVPSTDTSVGQFEPNLPIPNGGARISYEEPGPKSFWSIRYQLAVDLQDQTSFGGCWFWYQRDVMTPTGLSSTFADVPVGHPFYRYVEALNAAGITGGCGGGNYCPDQPITRGQMAVFLSVALGLYWRF